MAPCIGFEICLISSAVQSEYCSENGSGTIVELQHMICSPVHQPIGLHFPSI